MQKYKKYIHITFDFNKDLENKYLKRFLYVFTELGSTIGASLLLVFLAIISGLKILYVFVPIYLFQLIIVEGIKMAFKHPRPRNAITKNVWGVKVSSGSFPSGHASNAFTTAFLMSNYYGLNTALISVLFFTAGGVALSRVLLGKHYLIDIIGGAFFGIVLSVIGSLGFISLLNNSPL